MPSDFTIGEEDCLALCIDNPKTKRSGGRVQHVVIRDADTVKWVSWLVAHLQVHEPLFTISGPVLRRRFAEICAAAGLEEFGFTPAGLRAGGATYLYMAGVAIDRLRFVGRWRVLSSLEHYIQEATAVQCLQKLPPGAKAIANTIAGVWPCLAQPPFFERSTCTAGLDVSGAASRAHSHHGASRRACKVPPARRALSVPRALALR